jgi:hypothetical protein
MHERRRDIPPQRGPARGEPAPDAVDERGRVPVDRLLEEPGQQLSVVAGDEGRHCGGRVPLEHTEAGLPEPEGCRHPALVEPDDEIGCADVRDPSLDGVGRDCGPRAPQVLEDELGARRTKCDRVMQRPETLDERVEVLAAGRQPVRRQPAGAPRRDVELVPVAEPRHP